MDVIRLKHNILQFTVLGIQLKMFIAFERKGICVILKLSKYEIIQLIFVGVKLGFTNICLILKTCPKVTRIFFLHAYVILYSIVE